MMEKMIIFEWKNSASRGVVNRGTRREKKKKQEKFQ